MTTDPRPEVLKAEILTETTLDKFVMAFDHSELGPLVRTFVYDIRAGRMRESALRAALAAVVECFDGEQSSRVWPSRGCKCESCHSFSVAVGAARSLLSDEDAKEPHKPV